MVDTDTLYTFNYWQRLQFEFSCVTDQIKQILLFPELDYQIHSEQILSQVQTKRFCKNVC